MKQWIPTLLLLCAFGACKKEIQPDEPSGSPIQFIENNSGLSVQDYLSLKDGNLLLYGDVQNGDKGYDGYLMKQTPDGRTLWFRMYGGISNDHIISVCEDDKGNLIMVGNTLSYGVPAEFGYTINYPDAWIFKTNSSGDIIWNKSVAADKDVPGTPEMKGYFEDRFMKIINDGKGGYLVGGATDNYRDINGNIIGTSWLLRYDESGLCNWSIPIERNKGEAEQISALTTDASGNPIVMSIGYNYITFIKLDGSLIHKTARTVYENSITTKGSDVARGLEWNGNSIVAFSDKRYSGSAEIRVRYLDQNLNVQRQLILDSLSRYNFKGFQLMNDALFFCGNFSNTQTASLDAFCWKLDDSGKLLSENLLQTLIDEQFKTIMPSTDNRMVLIGEAKRKGWNRWSPFKMYLNE